MKSAYSKFLFILFISTSLFAQKQSELDSLLKRLDQTSGTTKVHVLADLCWQYRTIKPYEALKYGNEGLNLAKELQYESGEANIWNKIGVVYRGIGQYVKALECYDNARTIALKIQDKSQLGYAYNNMGAIYAYQQNYSSQLEFSRKAIKIFEEIKDDRGLGFALIAAGTANNNLDKIEEALQYYQKSLELRKKQHGMAEMMITMRSIGALYFRMDNYSQAKNYYLQSIKIFEEEKLNNGSLVYSLLAKLYLKEKKLDSALYFAKKGYHFNSSQRLIELLTEDSKTLSNIYAVKGDYKNAYYFNELSYQSKDSLNKLESAKQITQHALNQKQQELELLKKDKNIQTAIIEKQNIQQRWIIISFIVVFGSVVTIALLVLRSRKKIQKAYRELESANVEIQHQEDRYRQIIENATDIIYRCDELGNFTYINLIGLHLFGYEEQEVIGFHFTHFVAPAERRHVRLRMIRQAQQKNENLYIEFSAIKKNGGEIILGQNVQLIMEHKTVKGFFAVARDITMRNHAEEELARRQQQLESVINTVDEGITLSDEVGKFIIFNNKMEEITGYTIREANETVEFTNLIYPDPKVQIEGLVRLGEVVKKGFITDVESTIRTKLGTQRTLLISTRLVEMKNQRMFLSAWRDITARKNAEQALRESEERYKLIVESANDIIYHIDKKGYFSYVNQTALHIFGYTAENAKKRHFLDFIHEDDYHRVKKFYLKQIVTKEPSSYCEFRARDKNNEIIWLGQIGQLIFNDNKNVTGFQAVMRDITERIKIEEELLKAKEAAEEANVAKSLFLATMSHEIRTPMNGVIGMTDLLLQTKLSSEQMEFTNIIRISGETLLTLINDILDFSKIESGKLELEKRPIEIQSIIEETFEFVATRALEKNLDLLYMIEPNTPQFIVGDPTRLRQIILNLVSNAIKFTHEGEVLVSVKEVRRTTEFTELKISVKDTGIGIPAEKVGTLFQMFTQVDASTTRKYGGTGLGLAISKRLTELMQGTIWVESEEGKGSTFSFTFIAPTTEDVESLPRRFIRGKIPELQGRRVLIVDDNKTNLNILSIQCTNWGIHPRATSSVTEAMSWLNANDPFDIAILDLHMPEIDGIQLARKIRTVRDSRSLPLILFSSLQNDLPNEDRELFQSIITKPIKQSQLHASILDVCTKGAAVKYDRLQQQAVRIEKLSDRIPLSILVAEDNIINQKLAVRLLLQLGYRVDIAPTGVKVLEMIKRKQYDIILMDIHMPDMDGLVTTRFIVNNFPIEERPKIIAMTADAMSGDREKCIDAGMDDYITKPIRLDVLLSVLEQFGEEILKLQSNMDPFKINKDSMRLRMQELQDQTDPQFIYDIMKSVSVQAKDAIVFWQKAVDEHDLEQTKFYAHKLRGMALNIGAKHLAQICKRMEELALSGKIPSSDDRTVYTKEYEIVMSAAEELIKEFGG